MGTANHHAHAQTNGVDLDGYMSSSSSANPAFHNATQVQLPSCDGGSFMGQGTLALPGGQVLHFGGSAIVAATLARLQAEFGLGASAGQEVLLAGASAGGLAAILNADRVRALLPPTVTKYKVLSDSGFFLDAPTTSGVRKYAQEMRMVFAMQGMSQTLSPACQAAQPAGEAWRCVLAPVAVPHVTSPLFVLDDAADGYQLTAIAEIPGAKKALACAEAASALPGPLFRMEDLKSADFLLVVNYVTTFSAQLAASGLLQRPGNGAFVATCATHTLHIYSPSAWEGLRLVAEGGAERSAREAVTAWWRGEDGGNTSFLPCDFYRSSPHQCNPTCPDTAPASFTCGAEGSSVIVIVAVGCGLLLAWLLYLRRVLRRRLRRVAAAPKGREGEPPAKPPK